MKRTDLYIFGLTFLHFVLFFRIMLIITAGAGLSLMGEQSMIGHICAVLFIATFISIFYNLSCLIPVIASHDEEAALKSITRVARGSLFILVVYTVLEFLQALSYISMYQSY